MGKYNFRTLRITLIFVFTLGLVGCPETPSKSLREQVRDAEEISGYKSNLTVIEKKEEVNRVASKDAEARHWN
ncbi:hypothetical protein R3D73_005005 [Serratia marcescens]|nr:hypothetical protein [Serratia marcescens]ELQ9442107.1 hypothetical protein [Serratia marcescens]ELT5562897.1 hypothetical protein [Serratia marcescens]